jgi:hypothetical protein
MKILLSSFANLILDLIYDLAIQSSLKVKAGYVFVFVYPRHFLDLQDIESIVNKR